MPDRLSPLSQARLALARRNFRSLIVPALWLAYIVWMIWGTAAGIITLLQAASAPPSNPYAGLNPSPALLALNLWGLGAGLVFGLLVANPMAWRNGKRLILGTMALAMVLGRLISGGVLGLLLAYVPVPGWIALVAMPFALLLSGIGVIVVLGLVVGALFSFFVGVPVLIFNQIFAFEHALAVYRYQSNSLAGYISRFVLWLRNERAPRPAPDDSKGARFATLEERLALWHPDGSESMAFGHCVDPMFVKTDKHILIMASTRSGKGVTLIIPHLLRYAGSAFVLDPKGENARATGRRRAELNREVHYLDPFGISGKPKSRFNPLSRFTPLNMEAESKALAAALFVVGERERDHWTAAGQQLLAAIILYVYVSPDIPKDKKDLPTVRRILLGGIKDALDKMTQIDDADGLLRDLAVSFIETPEKEFGSVVSTTQRQTEILDNPFMVACLSATGPGREVDFKAWRTGTMTVYLCLSAPKFPTFNRWLRLVLTSALDEMTDTLDPPRLPVCFMLDELATLGHLAAVENAVGLAAGYGIQLVTVFQDTAQMRDLYKARWASFIGNAGVRALFNLDDYDTAAYWSKFMGECLVPTSNRSLDIYGYSKGENQGESLRPLLPPEEIMMRYASEIMLVLVQGAHPIVCDRVPYWADRTLDGLWDDPRTPSEQARLTSQPKAPPAPPAAASPPVASRQEPATGWDTGPNWPQPSEWDNVSIAENAPAAMPPKPQSFIKPYQVPPGILEQLPRNALCPCGSGQKLKHCHGREGAEL